MDAYPAFLTRLVLPLLARCSDIKIWNLYADGMSAETLPLEELRSLQARRLRQIIRHASARVPFYRDRFAALGVNADDIVDGMPLPFRPTTKDDIMAHFPDEICTEGVDRSGWRYVATTGTSRQVMAIHDKRKATTNWAAGIRAHKLAGAHELGARWMSVPPHMCTKICGENDGRGAGGELRLPEVLQALARGDLSSLRRMLWNFAHARRESIYRRVTLPSFAAHGTNPPDDALDHYLDTIAEYRPRLLEGLPLHLHAFAKRLERAGATPPDVRVIKPYGGSLTPGMKRTIQQAFDCSVFDTYGSSELGFIACDCVQHEGLHVFMDLFHVEVCRNGRLAEPGELGRIYITDLSNYAMPLIRYDVGDVGRYFEDDHGCGRRATRIQVEGRVEDTLVNEEGDILTSDRLFDFFHGYTEIDNFQLIERFPRKFELLCVPTNGARMDQGELTTAFSRLYGADVEIDLCWVKTIRSEPGGKFRFVKPIGTAKI